MAEGDVKISFDPVSLAFDLSIEDDDLVADKGLESAVMISLFTDRRARDDDILPDHGSDDRRGWFGDLVNPEVEEDQIGSRLWLLERAKTTQNNINRCKLFVEEALQWMVEDGIAAKIEGEAERQGQPGSDILAFSAKIFKSDGTFETFRFDANWIAQFE